jgi:hypothetical protein
MHDQFLKGFLIMAGFLKQPADGSIASRCPQAAASSTIIAQS